MNIEQIIPQIDTVKKPRGRPRIDRIIIKKEKLNKVKQLDYFKNYYDNTLSVKIKCDVCNSEVCMQKIRRHQRSKKCILLKKNLIN